MNELERARNELVAAAEAARSQAYAPYSRFQVGAAVRTDAGEVFSGCNVENASYGATICAERAAVLAMVTRAVRPEAAAPGWRPRITAVAVFTDAPTLAMPCGVCRQVLAEFEQGAEVIVASPRLRRVLSFAELFPEPFVLESAGAER